MMGSNLMEEIDCGSFFDQIDDLIEFPADNCTDFHGIWSNSEPIFPANNTNNSSHISPEIDVPYEDIVQLEWISNFVEDSFSGGGMMISKEHAPVEKHNQFQTSSPVSVLESSSSSSETSSSEGKHSPLSPTHRGPQRARTKRPRPTTFNPRLAIQLLSPTSSVSSESENFTESHNPIKKISDVEHKPSDLEHKKKKIKKIKFSLPSPPMEMNRNPPSQAIRKCMHCEITKTPQWRAGPMGPKTLCNACGVRHKSGRLFPEYRPAASPTFVPYLHSNSHKKVIEMRTKVCDETSVPGTKTANIQTERAVSLE